MITRGVPDLHPDSDKYYRLQWSATELGDSVTIDSVDWTVPVGLLANFTGQEGLLVGVRLSAPTATEGEKYDVTCQIGTSLGETLNEVIRIRVSTDGH